MNLPFNIAVRYLFARKSHNVINIISAISAIGIAVGSAALILILSVYNGFDALIRENMQSIDADLVIRPLHGKTFIPEGETFEYLLSSPEISRIGSVIEETVFTGYGSFQGAATVKGVDRVLEEESPVREKVTAGEFTLHNGDIPLASIGASLAHRMGANPRFVTPLQLYFPDRGASISPANPAASLRSVKVWPGSIFAAGSEVDADLVIVPIEVMQELMGYAGGEVTSVELTFREDLPNRAAGAFQKDLSARLGDGFKVLDRFRQHPSLYKMMRYEKAAIYLILIFVVIIIAFNIFGSLTMLVIEKEDDIATLKALGAGKRLIRRVFVTEGWMISLLGLAAGILAGIVLVLLQSRFGIVKMPGNFAIKAYPVILEFRDILSTITGVAAIGFVTALIPVRKMLWKQSL